MINKPDLERTKDDETANHNLITDLGMKVNMLKGYESAYSNPKKGIMIINQNGQNFLVSAEYIGEGEISEASKAYAYKFR